jgi:hypothetical protein
LAQARVLRDQEILHTAIFFQATIQAAGFLRVPPKSSLKELMLSTKLWQYAKMSTTFKALVQEMAAEQLAAHPVIH